MEIEIAAEIGAEIGAEIAEISAEIAQVREIELPQPRRVLTKVSG